MEYLIYAGVFIGGWILAKLDRMAGGKHPISRKDLEDIATQSFRHGAQYGYEYRMKEETGGTNPFEEKKPESFQVGFVSAKNG